MHSGLILKPAEPEHWLLGSVDPDINPSGDWTAYKASDEPQSTQMFDSNGCALFGTGHALISLAKFHQFQDFPQDISERYLGVECNTTPDGTDPHEVIETIRTISGVIPAAVLPWSSDLETYDEYYKPKPMDSVILKLGKALLDKFIFNHKWVFAFGSSYKPADKQSLLKEALKKGPICVSINGNYRTKNGRLTKTIDSVDSHWVQLLRFDGDYGVIFDQYAPFIKTLDKNYDHNAAKVYFLARNQNPVAKSFFSQLWDSFSKLWSKQS